jgi:DNA processing protein
LNELEALVVLTSIPFLGPVKIKHLINTFGSPLNVLKVSPDTIEEMRGFGSRIATGFQTWQDNKYWKENLSIASKWGVEIIPFTSLKYPKELKKIDDHPILLYLLGNLLPQDEQSIGIVGTRVPSIYGLETAEKLGRDLAEKGFTIISGLARGIDTAAHVGALKKGRTLAVIGSGIGHIYPKENLKLAESIAKNGAVISEFPMMMPPERQNFPKRNRIVSGMSKGVILIEAPIESGAMITMGMAIAQNKKIFAIPGRIDNKNFEGNHLLIKRQEAKLIENAEDVCCTLESFSFDNNLSNVNNKINFSFSKDEQELFLKLPVEEFSIEELAQLTHAPLAKLNVLLMGLMLKKAIREYPGKMYKRLDRG